MVVSTAKMMAWQFLRLGADPPGVKLELVDGEVSVSPSPTPSHGYVVAQLGLILAAHIRQFGLGELYYDIDTLLDEFNVRRPDIMFFSKQRLHLIGEKCMEGVPDLAVEVVSPSSVWVDRQDKFEQYRVAKLKYYWIADPAMRTVEGWELKRSKYVSIGRAEGMSAIRLVPFRDLDIPLKQLWRKRIGNA